MKKTILMILMVLSLSLVITSTLAVDLEIDAAGGKNLLNLRTIYGMEDKTYGNSRTHMIPVDGGETYTIIMDRTYAEDFLRGSEEFEYEAYPGGIGVPIGINIDADNGNVYSEFVPECEYINIYNVPIPKGDSVRSYNIMLYKGSYAEFDGFEPYLPNGFIHQYAGTLSIDYDYMMTYEQILSMISAKDPDGETINKTVISDTFSSSDQKPGDYKIVFRAESNLIVTSYLLNISIYDQTAPVIEGPDTLEVEISHKISINEINQMYHASDNVDGSIAIEKTLDHYTNALALGVYTINYKAIDSSGNETMKSVKVTLVDETAPEFYGPKDLYIYTTDIPYTNEEILNTYASTDDVDGDCVVTITNDGYQQNTNEGIYQIELSTSDVLGNTATRIINIHVIDNRGPSFVVDELIIETTNTENLSVDQVVLQFNEHMAQMKMKVENVSISYNEYENHEDEAGDYYVYLDYDLDGEPQTSRVLISVVKKGWEFSPYYLSGIIPVIGIAVFIMIKKDQMNKMRKKN